MRSFKQKQEAEFIMYTMKLQRKKACQLEFSHCNYAQDFNYILNLELQEIACKNFSRKDFSELFLSLKLMLDYNSLVYLNLMGNILFKSNQCLRFYVILSILYILIVFIIYQTRHSFPNKCEPLPTKFCKLILYNSEDSNVLSIIFGVYFDP